MYDLQTLRAQIPRTSCDSAVLPRLASTHSTPPEPPKANSLEASNAMSAATHVSPREGRV